jgi:peptide/nickel transport system substrate-binding protein
MPGSNRDVPDLRVALDAALTRREMLRRLGVAGALMAVPSVVADAAQAGPFSEQTSAAMRSVASIKFGFPETVPNLDPAAAPTASAENATANSAEALLTYGSDGSLLPLLAESFSQPDRKTYVFKIRQGVKFSDGSPMTIDDVVYSCQRMWKGPTTVFGGLFANVVSMEAGGGNQLIVRLKAPSNTFKYLATFLFIGQKASLQAAGKNLGTPGNLGIYTGPYIMSSFTPGQSVTLTRNANYWGPTKPIADQIIYQIFGDTNTARLAMQSGQLDGVFRLPLGDIAAWKQLSNVTVIEGANPVQLYYGSFDNHEAPWNDVHVRRAISHCVDKRGILKAVFKGNGIAATTLPAPSEWSGLGLSSSQALRAYKTLPDYPFSVALAKQELAKSAYPKGFTNEVVVPSDSDPELTQAALNIAQVVKQIGIKLNVKEVPGAKFISIWETNKKNTGFTLIRNGPTFLDAWDFPSVMLLKRFDIPGSYNSANYTDPRVERLLNLAETTSSVAVRKKSIFDALKVAGAAAPYIPIVWGGGAMAINNKYKYVGFHPWAYLIQEWALRIKTA